MGPWFRWAVNVGCKSGDSIQFSPLAYRLDYRLPWASQQLLFHSSFARMGTHSLVISLQQINDK